MTELSKEERKLFDEAGGIEDPDAASKLKEQASRALDNFLSDSISIKEASVSMFALGGRSSIEHMIRQREILAFYHHGKWMLPKFQFKFGGLLAGYRQLVTFLLSCFKQDTLSVCLFLNENQCDLCVGNEEGMTPMIYLEKGGDYREIVSLLSDEQYG